MNKINFNPFPVLNTRRLVLRQLIKNDDKLIFDYQSNKENFKYVDMPIYQKIEEAQNFIAKMNKGVKNNEWIIWAITSASTNKILGTISIWNLSKEQSKAELGYGLFPSNVGKGIMSEALNKVLDYGINIMGLQTIEAYTDQDNIKSIKLLERNNFAKISTLIETNQYSGNLNNMVIYKIDGSLI